MTLRFGVTGAGLIGKERIRRPSAWDGYAASVAADASLKTAETGETVSVTLPERHSFYQR